MQNALLPRAFLAFNKKTSQRGILFQAPNRSFSTKTNGLFVSLPADFNLKSAVAVRQQIRGFAVHEDPASINPLLKDWKHYERDYSQEFYKGEIPERFETLTENMCVDTEEQVSLKEAIWGLLGAFGVLGGLFTLMVLQSIFFPSQREYVGIEVPPETIELFREGSKLSIDEMHAQNPTINQWYQFTKRHHRDRHGILYPSDLQELNKV
eukprot:TRINITY_DN2740_c0_g1_i1.p1 TRINITY_DN2740_c0_g1~~TRINITY_DN2740_c0_g1_i1.p1  ORF type:complete len:227 (-),score=51.70 TRINITY_DN2740_c0_g1_i1:194-820(-)